MRRASVADRRRFFLKVPGDDAERERAGTHPSAAHDDTVALHAGPGHGRHAIKEVLDRAGGVEPHEVELGHRREESREPGGKRKKMSGPGKGMC